MTRARWLQAAVLTVPLALMPFGQAQTLMQAKNNAFLHFALAGMLWTIKNRWLQAVIAWTWISFLLSGMLAWAFLGILGVLAWGLCYQWASEFTETEWTNVQRVITLAAAFQVVWMGVQALGVDPIFSALAYWGTPHAVIDPTLPVPPVGWFSNPMDTALFLGMSVPAILAILGAWSWLVLPVLAVALIVLQSSAGMACLAITLCWLVWRRQGWRGGLGMVGLMAVGLWGFVLWRDPGGLGIRVQSWLIAWLLIESHPVIGWGVNALDHRIVIDTAGMRYNFLFNEWLQWTFETGAIGLALVLGMLTRLSVRVCKTRDVGLETLAAVIVFALSWVSIPFRIGPVALLAALYLGRLEGLLTARQLARKCL